MSRRTRALPALANPFSRRRAPLSSGAGEPAVTRNRPAVAQAAREGLVREHVGGLDAETANPCRQADHRMGTTVRVLLEPLQAPALDLPDLLGEHTHRAIARCSSAKVLAATASPSAVRRVGLKPRMPRRASVLLIRLPIRVRSPIRVSRSRLGRLASSSSGLGITAMLQWSR